jgi:hypothetical protein
MTRENHALEECPMQGCATVMVRPYNRAKVYTSCARTSRGRRLLRTLDAEAWAGGRS